MPLPKRRHSTARGRRRRTHQKLAAPNLVVCSHCKQLKLVHRVCPYCGYYNDKPVVEIKEKKSKQARG
jgi:large subunit ribosomal protein L32